MGGREDVLAARLAASFLVDAIVEHVLDVFAILLGICAAAPPVGVAGANSKALICT
jgi:hypothetical protein